MSEVAELETLGKGLGYEGKELQDFMREERTSRRAERAKVREIEEKAKEREEREKAQVREMEEREKAREHELKKLELDISVSKQKKERSSDGEVKSVKMKLPPFDDSKEQINEYLFMFEKFAEANRWHQDSWAINLSALLKWKALCVFHRTITS